MSKRITSEFCVKCKINKRKFQRSLCPSCLYKHRKGVESIKAPGQKKERKRRMSHFSKEFLEYRGIKMNDKCIVRLDGNRKNKKSNNIIVIRKVHNEYLSKMLKFCKRECLVKGHDWNKEITLRIFIYIKRNGIPFIKFDNGVPNRTEI